jgi:AGZA family xanthine/uracil permease-like MFS transporter
MIGGGVTVGQATLYPVISAPLILVGTMMIGGLRHVPWDDPTEGIPAFLTVIMMPLSVSITGCRIRRIAYVVLEVAAGRRRDVHALLYVFAVLFVARYAFLRDACRA